MQSELTSKTNQVWTNICAPSPEELAEVVRTVALLPADGEFIAQNHHRAEITVRPAYLLILLHVPAFNRVTRVTSGASLYFIVTAHRLWTIQYDPIVIINHLIQDFTEVPDKLAEYCTDGPLSLALYLMNQVYSSAFKKLARLNQHINIAEDAVFTGNERKMVEEISILIRDVMDFRKVIRPQQRLFVAPPAHALLTPELATQWQRVGGQVNKVWEILESLFESVRELSRTNGKLLQLKESDLLQILTYYSILSIPAFILINPIDPYAEATSPLQLVIYWSTLSVLLTLLIAILLRFRSLRRRRIMP